MEGGEEVWTTDKEARGRAESKQRYMDTMMGEEDVFRPEIETDMVYTAIYKLYVVTKIPSCSCVL